MPTKRTDVAARLTAETGAFGRGLNRAGTQMKGFAGKVEMSAKRMRTAMKNVGTGNAAARIRGWGTSIAAFAGVYGLGQAIHAVREFEDSMEDLRRFGRKNQEWMARARKQMLGISDDTGVAKEQLAAFAGTFVELTGDADAAMKALGKMAKVSVATGSQMTDLASIMELLSGTFNIKGPEAMSAVIGKMARQALLGTMSFKNIASTIGQVGGVAAAQLGMKGEKGATDLAALMQLIVRVTRDPERTKTATLRFIESISKHHAKFKELTGVSLTTGSGREMKFKSGAEMSKIVGETYAKASPEMRQRLNKKVFADVRARWAVSAIQQASKVGWGKAQGKWAAPSKLFAAKGTEGGRNIIDVMYGEAAKSPGQKIRRATAQVTNEIHRKLLPALVAFAQHAGTLAKVLKWAFNNMQALVTITAAWKIGKLIHAFKAAKDITGAGAGIGTTTTATMNVRAATVNIMGGRGIGSRGRGGVAPMPSGTRELPSKAPPTRAPQKRSWFQTTTTAMGGTALGLSTGTLALLAPFFDWKAGETSPAFEKRKKAADARQRADRGRTGLSWMETSPLTDWMFTEPSGPGFHFGGQLGLGGVKPDVKEPNYDTMANTIATAVERAIQKMTVTATMATTAADKVKANSSSKAPR